MTRFHSVDPQHLTSAEYHLVVGDAALAERRLMEIEAPLNARYFHLSVTRYGTWNPWVGRAWLLAGDVAAARGRPQEAARMYRRLIGLWGGADPDVQPVVDQARAIGLANGAITARSGESRHVARVSSGETSAAPTSNRRNAPTPGARRGDRGVTPRVPAVPDVAARLPRNPELRMSTPLLAAIAGVIALLYVLPLLLAVIALRYGPPMKVPTVAAVDAAWLDQRWIDGAHEALNQLAELGFVLRTWLDGMSPRTSPTGMRCVAVLVNETTGDVAQIAVMERLDDRGDVELITVPVFAFGVGSKRVVTSNGDTPGVFLRPRDYAVQSFPMLYNAATLYSAHRAICARHVGAAKRGEIPRPGQEVMQVHRDTAEEFAYQEKRGMLKATPAGPYERTWRGAIYSVWRLHPRFIGRHKRRINASGLRMLAELGITPDPIVKSEKPDAACAADQLSPEMDAFISSACEEYTAGAKRLQEEWQLDQATRFDADMVTGVVRFHFADGHAVIGDAQVIGSWSRKAKSWEWAWNNPNVVSAVKADGERVREFGQKNGLVYMGTGFVPAPSLEIGAYLAAIGAKVIGASAVIPIPPGGDAEVVAFAALTNLRAVHSSAA